MLNRSYKYLVGIDCGVQTGVAIYRKDSKKLTTVTCLSILKAIEIVRELISHNPGGVKVRVEDARLRKYIPREKTESAERGRREGAGSVKRDAQIWEEFLKDAGVDYEMVAPKHNRTKMKADAFRKLTNWESMTNDHGRDAAMLVYGY